MKKRNIIVACEDNGIIGHGSHMPGWQNTDDYLQNFVPKTTGYPLIMGSETALSLKGPLKNRTNIAISRDPEKTAKLKERGFTVVDSFWKALDIAEQAPGEIIWIIGGGQIYKLALECIVINEIHLTKIPGSFPSPEKNEIYFPLDALNNYSIDYSRHQEFKKRPPNGADKRDKGNAHNAVVEVYKNDNF